MDRADLIQIYPEGLNIAAIIYVLLMKIVQIAQKIVVLVRTAMKVII